MVDFERNLPNERLDTANIVRGILKVQKAYAVAQNNRPLGRGTHTKGICARGTFEVFDLRKVIADPILASRLAQGPYARPGVYPAIVRFANAASTFHSDRSPDLRALSFSVNLAPEGSPPTYQDYSLQSNPTFPINDAHAFAVLMGVMSADDKARALLSLSPPDLFRFIKAAVIGGLQTHDKTRPYQTMRYWSTVPFRNGPGEAVKYSAIPRSDNPAHELGQGDNDLQDELIRHLNEDARMASFDFGLQLLDTASMTRWGMRKPASFWVENATVEWKEAQAPFHIVGRLTLLPQSSISPTECDTHFIDVTTNSTPETQPLGSVNRARSAAEFASRRVRMGQETAESVLDTLPVEAPAPRRRFAWFPKFAGALALLVLLGYVTTGFVYRRLSARILPPPQHLHRLVYLDQGWGLDRNSPDRQLYYYTPQGTGMHGIRYSWFVHLEQPFRRARLADPDHMRALNFIVDPSPTTSNPDLLPVGFGRRYDPRLRDDVVDITCSACHTGQINHTDANGVTTAVRIDGGPAMSAFTDVKPGSFQMDLGLGLFETLVNPLKFQRFAKNVLGADGNTLSNQTRLWQDMAAVASNLVTVFRGSSNAHLYPTQEGYGRTDALARIANVVFGDHITSANYSTGDAPVSYPYLWNIWKFDWVQYNASVSQPMARNVGEALGVGADFQLVDDYGRPVPQASRFQTSVQFDSLLRIESTLQKLTPPGWPEDILGPINQQSAARGKALFAQHCAICHGPHPASNEFKQAVSPGRLPDDPLWVIRWKPLDVIGTDPNAAQNFANNRVDLSKTGVSYDEVRRLLFAQYDGVRQRDEALVPALQKRLDALKQAPADDPVRQEYSQELYDVQKWGMTKDRVEQSLNDVNLQSTNGGVALNALGLIIRERYYTDRHISPEAQACFSGFNTLDTPQVVKGYKPRPLQGVWATPPFLHNGSVPNLRELLSPAERRSTRFYVGYREFDPVNVGYATQPPKDYKGGFWFDTTLSGNHNTGHQFASGYTGRPQNGIIGPLLSDQDRTDIIEYLKVMVDDPNPQHRKPIDCFALLK